MINPLFLVKHVHMEDRFNYGMYWIDKMLKIFHWGAIGRFNDNSYWMSEGNAIIILNNTDHNYKYTIQIRMMWSLQNFLRSVFCAVLLRFGERCTCDLCDWCLENAIVRTTMFSRRRDASVSSAHSINACNKLTKFTHKFTFLQGKFWYPIIHLTCISLL